MLLQESAKVADLEGQLLVAKRELDEERKKSQQNQSAIANLEKQLNLAQQTQVCPI